jgi:hypothetical protein
MRPVVLLTIAATLFATNSVDVLVPGLSYHANWDEAGKPNQFNYGLGLSYTQCDREGAGWGQMQVGGIVYKDSFGELSTVGLVGLGVRTPTTVSAEVLCGIAAWNGSGTQGLSPLFYVGVGYQLPSYALFIDVTSSNGVTAAWLKFSITLPK